MGEDLSFETQDSPLGKRFACQDAGVVDKILGGEIVRTVHDKVIFSDDIQNILHCKALMIGVDADMGIYLPQFLSGGIHLVAPHVRREVYHLALQVGKLHRVTVRNADCPHSAAAR